MKPFKVVEKPWGREIWIAVTEIYALKDIEINKGTRSSLQYHNLKEEHIYIISGVAQCEEMIDGKLTTNKYFPGDVIHNPPGKQHRMTALEQLRLIEVSTPYLDDVVRVEDDFGR